jgi:hypothetical protein
MARKRRKKSSYRRRSRRLGAVGMGGQLTQALGIIGGAIAGNLVQNKLLANVTAIPDAAKSAVVVAAGIFFPKVVKGDLGKALGNGMIAAGGVNLAKSVLPAGMIGYTDTIDFPVSVGEVPDNLSVIAGGDDVMAGDDLSVLAGMDEDEGDY